MSEENKIEEEVKEINPIDEYLNNYKERKLAEFCVQKDKEIASHKEQLKRLIERITELNQKVDEYDKKYNKTWNSVDGLYSEIKKLSVDNFLKLYHLISIDITGDITTAAASVIPASTLTWTYDVLNQRGTK